MLKSVSFRFIVNSPRVNLGTIKSFQLHHVIFISTADGVCWVAGGKKSSKSTFKKKKENQAFVWLDPH